MSPGSDLIAGAWDLHVHAAPSLFERWGDVWDLAQVCGDARMAGFVLKSHHGSSVESAAVLDRKVPDLKVFGGVVLNQFVGGLNPFAVEAALGLGAKIVWLPTIHAAAHHSCFGVLGGFPFQSAKVARHPLEGIRILNDRGQLVSPLTDILEVLDGRPMVLATGHLSAEEILALHAFIKKQRLDIRLLVTHVFFNTPSLSVDQLRSMQSERTWFEIAYFTISPNGNLTAGEVATRILRLPAAQWVLASDTGQQDNLRSPDALTVYANALLKAGIPQERVRRMLCDEPRRLLGI